MDLLRFVRLHEGAIVPTRCTPLSAGVDLSALSNCTIPAHGNYLVRTGLSVQVPVGCYGRIAERSGLALRRQIAVGGGVVDPDYTGEIYVILINHSNNDYDITAGDRIAQFICEKVLFPKVTVVDAHDVTVRGNRGLGSSGE